MRILGIDPGYDRLGLAVIEKSPRGKDALLFSSCFQTSPKDGIPERFLSIGTEIGRVIEEWQPDAVALESLFFTKNQKTAMRVAESRGIAIYEASRHGIGVFEYGPMEIKSSVTGDGRSDKANIAKMVRLLVDVPDRSALDDEYDAIAVALTHSAVARKR